VFWKCISIEIFISAAYIIVVDHSLPYWWGWLQAVTATLVSTSPECGPFYCCRPSNLPSGRFLMFIFRESRVLSRLQSGRSGVWIPAWARGIYLFQNLHTGSGAHSASYSTGTGVLSRSESIGAWIRPPTPPSVEVKNEWSFTSTPLAFRAWKWKICLYFLIICWWHGKSLLLFMA
jgi:hypothetical protein